MSASDFGSAALDWAQASPANASNVINRSIRATWCHESTRLSRRHAGFRRRGLRHASEGECRSAVAGRARGRATSRRRTRRPDRRALPVRGRPRGAAGPAADPLRAPRRELRWRHRERPAAAHHRALPRADAAGSSRRRRFRSDRAGRAQAGALRSEEPLRAVLVPSPSARLHRRAGLRRTHRAAGSDRRGRRRARCGARPCAGKSARARHRGGSRPWGGRPAPPPEGRRLAAPPGSAPRHRHPARERYAPLAAGTVCESASGDGAQGRLADGAELALFSLRVDGTPMRTPPLPSRLSALPESAARPEAPTRRLRLDFDERAGFLIDQTPYRADEIAFSVSRGAREIGEIKNSPIWMPHPMHLHGFGFRVLRRQGTYGEARRLAAEPSGRLVTDLGVKDTVVLWPNETLWLAMDFTLPEEAAFRGTQRFMFHCHNLEHEDGMMMRNFSVI